MATSIGLKDGSEIYSEKIERRHGLRVLIKNLQRTYIVQGNTANDDEEIIKAASGLPAIGSRLRGMVCRNLQATQMDSGSLLWEVMAKFDNNITEDDEQDEQEKDPTARIAKWKWDAEFVQERLQYDAVEVKEIVNSAGQPILVSHPVAIPVLIIQRYERFPFDPKTILNYVNYVNDGPFWGADEGNALMASITAGFDENINDVRVVPVTYRIKFKIEWGLLDNGEQGPAGELGPKKNSWQFRPIDEGTKYKDGSGNWVAATDAQGNPIKVNLDGAGGLLADGADPEHLNFNRYPKTNFDALSLGPFV